MSMRIVRAQREQVQALLTLCRTCLAPERSLSSMEHDILDRDCHMLTCQGEILGYVCMQVIPPEAEVCDICIRPESRSQGLGQQLLSHAIAEAEKNGVEDVFLEVRASNLPAIRLYEKNGFAREGVRKAYYNGREDAFIMRRRKA